MHCHCRGCIILSSIGQKFARESLTSCAAPFLFDNETAKDYHRETYLSFVEAERIMWWNFDEPPFVLPPKHAAVFKIGAACLSDSVGWERWEDDWPDMGLEVFDNLSQGQKQAAILIVAKALLDPTVEPPKVTAVLAATVDAIYREIESNIEFEIGVNEQTSFRERILAAMDEMNYWDEINESLTPDEEPETPLLPDSNDQAEWSELVESLRTCVLEDYDFDMAKEFLDMPPEKAAELKRQMNIHPDYYTAIVPDPTAEQVAETRRQLRNLLH